MWYSVHTREINVILLYISTFDSLQQYSSKVIKYNINDNSTVDIRYNSSGETR